MGLQNPKYMKHILPFLLLFLFPTLLSAQEKDAWHAFWNTDTTLIGFKDAQGKVMIEPRFMGFTTAQKFDHIIAVTEQDKENWKSYYLTRSGKIIGRDSLYTFDNGPDCESEGFIRFRDPKTELMGMFNREGKIVIPAIHSALTPVRNGMIVALKDAQKQYWNKDKHEDGCNHYSWTGGTETLIDTANNALISRFDYTDRLNFFTLKISPGPDKDPSRKSFAGNNGQYYSFVDFEQEFRQWLQQKLLDHCSKEDLLRVSYPQITWEAPDAWNTEAKTGFIDRNLALLQEKFQELKEPGTEYFISRGGLNQFMFEGPEFEPYFNNCGEAKEWLYPTMTIVISHSTKDDFTQDHLEFLRTEQGYKLICVTIRKGSIR